jgi:hypothetical protein
MSLRDAGAERLTDSGARLLGAVVATPRNVVLPRICGEDRRMAAIFGLMPAIEFDLAGISLVDEIPDDGTTTNG